MFLFVFLGTLAELVHAMTTYTAAGHAYTRLVSPIEPPNQVISVSASESIVLFVTSDGHLWLTGMVEGVDFALQIEQNSTVMRTIPRRVPGWFGVTSAAYLDGCFYLVTETSGLMCLPVESGVARLHLVPASSLASSLIAAGASAPRRLWAGFGSLVAEDSDGNYFLLPQNGPVTNLNFEADSLRGSPTFGPNGVAFQLKNDSIITSDAIGTLKKFPRKAQRVYQGCGQYFCSETLQSTVFLSGKTLFLCDLACTKKPTALFQIGELRDWAPGAAIFADGTMALFAENKVVETAKLRSNAYLWPHETPLAWSGFTLQATKTRGAAWKGKIAALVILCALSAAALYVVLKALRLQASKRSEAKNVVRKGAITA